MVTRLQTISITVGTGVNAILRGCHEHSKAPLSLLAVLF